MQFHCTKMSKYYPEPYEPFGGDISVTIDLSNAKLQLIFFMQQNQILKIFHMLILRVLH